ncbi:ubiquitin-conjugating enzyme E2 7-like [Quercus suber]|uniref:ubiquitin-conjugating enzyme E2 7-like n=1 Tax=Quercus suber TaxID=58331 RepID=UPI0032DEE920
MISFSDSTAWQEVESIVLSIISMLSGPNHESPSNVEAAKEWRDRKDKFKKKVSRCLRKSQEAGHQCLFSACGCRRGLKLCTKPSKSSQN